MAKDTYQLVAVGQTGSEYWEFVQHFMSGLTNGTDPVGDAAACISSWRDSLESLFMACLPAAVTITGYKCKRINNSGGPTAMLPITPVAGTKGGTLATGCVGPCLVSPFDDTERWSAGKFFLPGVAQADITSNHFSSGLLTVVQDFIAELVLQHTVGTTWDFVIWSRKLLAPIIPFDVEISLKAGVQKRRLTPVV